jgi:hypothetical protein
MHIYLVFLHNLPCVPTLIVSIVIHQIFLVHNFEYLEWRNKIIFLMKICFNIFIYGYDFMNVETWEW